MSAETALDELVAAHLSKLRREHPGASTQAWARLTLDAIRRYADRGPTERQNVASLAGITTRPKMITNDGRLVRVETEQILVTPRGVDRYAERRA